LREAELISALCVSVVLGVITVSDNRNTLFQATQYKDRRYLTTPLRNFVRTMTTHTKPPRLTIAQSRQADLAEGILKLSPSSLTFLHDECLTCFWHHYNGRPRLATPFPKVFGALDNV